MQTDRTDRSIKVSTVTSFLRHVVRDVSLETSLGLETSRDLFLMVSVSKFLVSVSRSIEIRQALQQEMHAFLISKHKHEFVEF